MNRRNFFQSLISATGLLTVATLLKTNSTQAQERRRGGGASAAKAPGLVDPKDAQAKQVNYVHKHADVKDKAIQVDRQGVKWTDQKCKNCVFYIKLDKENKVSGMIVGGCAMPFAKDKVVAENGWCTSWAKKG